MRLSRRTLLKVLLCCGAVALPSYRISAAPGAPAPAISALAADIADIIGRREVGFDLRQVDPTSGDSYFRVQVNADELYPVASCFKTWVALYYFWNTPQTNWLFEPGSPVHSVVVFSNNTLTGTLLAEVGTQINVYGNAIEKFNDFLIFTVGMQNGLYRWNWGGNPLEGLIDRRFAPTQDARYVDVSGTRYVMDNLFTAADLSNGYAFLLRERANAAAVDATLSLCGIPATDYVAPIERAFGRSYTGKDGVLPADLSAVGRVINDAGIIEVGSGTYILSMLCAGEGEFECIMILRQIAERIAEYEANR